MRGFSPRGPAMNSAEDSNVPRLPPFSGQDRGDDQGAEQRRLVPAIAHLGSCALTVTLSNLFLGPEQAVEFRDADEIEADRPRYRRAPTRNNASRSMTSPVSTT